MQSDEQTDIYLQSIMAYMYIETSADVNLFRNISNTHGKSRKTSCVISLTISAIQARFR